MLLIIEGILDLLRRQDLVPGPSRHAKDGVQLEFVPRPRDLNPVDIEHPLYFFSWKLLWIILDRLLVSYFKNHLCEHLSWDFIEAFDDDVFVDDCLFVLLVTLFILRCLPSLIQHFPVICQNLRLLASVSRQVLTLVGVFFESEIPMQRIFISIFDKQSPSEAEF